VAPLDASSGQGEARIVSSELRRGVRMELFVAPASFLLPALVGWIFVDLGLRNGAWPYVVLGGIIFAGNVVFDYLMVRTALRFLRRAKHAPRAPPDNST
jgi:heme A synthase